ncbi:MAG TPA: class I SAM-dependent methyltransferase [Pseudonocardiaceae bacterium]
MRAVDEVFAPYQRRQAEQLSALTDRLGAVAADLARTRAELADLRAALRDELVPRLRAELDGVGDRVIGRVSEFENRARRDTVFASDMTAAQGSAEFIRRHMVSARRFDHPHATLEHALSLAPTGGMALEFGVFTGSTLTIIAKARGAERVYGFDSFQGLPEDWRAGFPAGTFDVAAPPSVPGAELVVGLFEDSLPGFLAEHAGPVDFLHIDADLYSAAHTVLSLVGPRLQAGSVIVFDEFLNYPGWPDHECRAWQEYVAETGVRFRYEAYTYDNEQVALRVIAP